MPKHTGRHSARHSAITGMAVFLVLALSGFIFMVNLRVNRTAVVLSDTADLVEQRVEHVNKLQKEVESLSSQIDQVNKTLDSDTQTTSSEDAGSGIMLPKVEGAGITVTLDDSPLWENAVDDSGSTANINDYVIHQQDVEAVVNALWAGGAESMMIQDQRILASSAVICSGNILLLQGRKYSPPYTISAIGPTERMRKALDSSPAIKIYKQYVASFGLGWDVQNKNNLKFDAAVALLQPLRYATVSTPEELQAQQDNNHE